MFYSDEMVNYVLNYSKTLVDQINSGKNCPKELKELQYLIFAGMISYYGFEHITEIYDAFMKTSFIYSKKPIIEVLSSRPGVNKNLLDYLSTSEPKAFLENQIMMNLAGQIKIDRLIYLFEDKNCSPDDFLEFAAHEINHVVNSMKNSICKRKGHLVSRFGVALKSINSSAIDEGLLFEESVNVLQTAEVVNEILGFADYKIEDPEIRRTLHKLRSSAWGKKEKVRDMKLLCH